MRKLCLLLVAVWGTIVCSAQPVITSSSFTPQAGESFIVTKCLNGQPAGSGGAAVSWHYTIIPTNEADTLSYFDSDPFGTSDSFIDCNLIELNRRMSYGQLFSYMRSNADSITVKGYRSPDFTSGQFLYRGDPYSRMRFPLTYAGGWHDSVKQPTCDTTINFHDVEYDGYGTLDINATTYSNIVRLKTILRDTATSDCSFGPGIPPVLSYTDTIYDYYTAGYHCPILTIRYSIHGNTTYLSRRNTVSVASPEMALLSSGMVPNPSDMNTRVAFSLGQPAHCSVSVIDMTGQALWRHTEIEGKAGNNVIEIATDKLPAGMYTVILNTGRENHYTRLTVVH